MRSASGVHLGPYELIEKIGEGGMGEVWRARDTRLNRDVAVKVLPESLAEDPDRLRRFVLEAQSAGGLNHPHILAIHDVGTEGGTPFLISELLEGESLRSRLRGGKLSPSKAIEFARQAAAGLAAAHAKGIVHRDIKPENLFVTREGQIKILDFGLAKLKAPVRKAEATIAETETIGTDPGMAVGTAGYMSPEQVRGEEVDHRSDLCSLGCVMYEMLAGQKPFQGATQVETMHAILKDDPPEDVLPPGLDRIVAHCLEKDPAARFQSARDLAFQLEALSHSSQRVTAAAAKVRTRMPLGWVAVAGLALLALGLAGGYLAGKRSEGAVPPQFRRLTFRRGHIAQARFTPDGSGVVYGAAWDGDPYGIFSIRLDSPEFHQPVLPKATALSVSSQGELAVLLNPRITAGWQLPGVLARLPVSGGGAREVLENVQWAEWSPRGDLAVVRRSEQTAQLEYPIGKVLVKTGGMIQCPRFSASGEEIAFLSYPRLTDTAGSVETVDLAGNRKTLTEKWPNVWGLAWHPRTREIWFSAGKTGAKFDLYAVTRAGAVRPILLQMSNGVIQDIAQDGRVLLSALNQQMRMRYVDDSRKMERDLSWLDWSMVHAISADGEKVVFGESGEGSGEAFVTYIRKTDGSPAVRLGEGGFPDLSPDGRQVAAAKQEADGIVLLPVGAGEAKQIPLPGFHVNFVHWRAGTRSLLFSGTEGGKGLRIWEISADAPGAPRPLTPEGMVPMFGVSRDGRYFAAADARTQQLLVYPLDGGKPVTVSAYEPGEVPMAMTGDGSSVLVVQRGMLPARVMKLDWRTGKRELWREIQPPDRAGVMGLMIFAVTPDLRQYTYSYLQQLSDLHLVAGLR